MRLVALLSVVTLLACGSMPPDRAALSALQTIRATSESILKVHAALWNKGLSTDERRAKVDKAYTAVNLSCNAAAVGLSAVKTWADMAKVVSVPQQNLAALQALVPEFKE